MNDQTKILIQELVFKALEETIREPECRQLESLIHDDAECRAYYLHAMEMNYGISKIHEVIGDRLEMTLTLEAMADYEKQAPAAEPEEIALPAVVPCTEIRPARSRVSKFSVYAAVCSSAALIFFMVFAHFESAPIRHYASVVENFEAVWEDSSNALLRHDPVDGRKRFLKKGMVKIRMNDGTQVVVEGPSEFSLENDSQMFLVRGKMTASVPTEALGFTVRTPSASVVDYGTEFGIAVDQYANTEAHVKKGQVDLRLGSDTRVFDASMRLSTDQAGRVSGKTLTAIAAANRQFAYDIPAPFEATVQSLGAAMYLRAMEDSNTDAQDVLGFPGSGIEVDPSLSVTPGPLLGDGRRAHAFCIQSPDNVIRIHNVDSLPQSPDGSFSIGFWVRFAHIREQVISSHLIEPVRTKEHYRLILLTGDGRLKHCAYRPGVKPWRVVTSPEPLNAGVWYFVMITRRAGSGDEKSLYINGQPVQIDIGDKDETGAGDIGRFRSMQFGGPMDTFGSFEGDLAEIVLFPRALRDTEVRLLYQAANRE